MKNFSLWACILLFTGLLSSCDWWREKRIAAQDIELSMVDLRDSLRVLEVTSAPEKMQAWHKRYAPFFRFFSSNVIGIGDPDSVGTAEVFQQFLQAPIVLNAQHNISRVYTPEVLNQVKTEIRSGFQHFHYYFPEKNLPKVFFYCSGYNTSLMLGDNFVGASLEKFLGDTASIYRELGIAPYFYPQMKPSRIAIELLAAWFQSVCPEPEANTTLLDRMIWEGKKICYLEHCFPKLSTATLMAYSEPEWKVLESQEMALWTKLVEDQQLFQKQSFRISQLCDPAPFTALISQSTPGRAGSWIGSRIVKAYLHQSKKNLADVLQNTDSRNVLEESQYKP